MKPSSDMKALVIGGGTVAVRSHIPAVVELLAPGHLYVAEPDPQRRAHLSSQFDHRHVSADYQDFLEKVDFALVATPPHLHAPISVDCLEAGLPVLCEKPLANTVAECESILEAARRTSLPVGVCHNYRYFPNRARVRAKLRAGDFGREVSADIVEGGPASWPSQSGYTFRKELVPGGVMLNNGVHSLDFLLWCFGPPVEFEYRDDSLGGLESNAEIRMRFAHNCRGRLRISRTGQMPNTIVVTGEHATASLPVFDMHLVKHSHGVEERVVSIDGRPIEDKAVLARWQLADFVNAVASGRPPRCDGEAGKAVLEVIERCYMLKQKRPLPPKAPVPGLMW